MDYCDKCGGTEIETTNILDWERMYEDKYCKKFLNQMILIQSFGGAIYEKTIS